MFCIRQILKDIHIRSLGKVEIQRLNPSAAQTPVPPQETPLLPRSHRFGFSLDWVRECVSVGRGGVSPKPGHWARPAPVSLAVMQLGVEDPQVGGWSHTNNNGWLVALLAGMVTGTAQGGSGRRNGLSHVARIVIDMYLQERFAWLLPIRSWCTVGNVSSVWAEEGAEIPQWVWV